MRWKATTFSHVLERGDYRSEHVACVTLDGLWVLLHRWIVEVYTREYRRGSVQGVPVKLWERAMEKGFVPRLPANREALAVLLSRRAVRTVHRYGIELEGLLYQDARLELAPLLWSLQWLELRRKKNVFT